VWIEAGSRLGFLDGTKRAGAESLSLEGLSISGTLDIRGDGLARIIDGRIVSALPTSGAVTSEFAR